VLPAQPRRSLPSGSPNPADEPNQTFTLTSSDDDSRPTVAWEAGNVSVDEGISSALLDVLLSNPSAHTVTVTYVSSDGSATAGSGYNVCC
jgi:Calx-beta domain